MKIRPKVLMQYVLILLLFYLNDSFLYMKVLKSYDILILALCIGLFVYNKKLVDKRNVLFLSIMLAVVAFLRVAVGGVGLNVWSTWAIMILVTTIAIRWNTDDFLTRFINVVFFMAGTSCVIFVVGLVAPSIYKSLTVLSSNEFTKITHWYTGSNYVTTDFKEYGMLFYALRDYDKTRNNGVFGEPGLYQMILNTAYFCLLFFRSDLKFNNKKYKKILTIIILTIITTQSTSGLLSLAVTTLAFILSSNTIENQEQKNYVKNYVIAFVVVGFVTLGMDYVLRGTNSIIYKTVLKKLFSNGSFALDADTGYYRIVTVLGCLQAIVTHPFGMGYDALGVYLQGVVQGEYVAAQILVTFAALGVIPALIIIYWVFSPVINRRTGVWFSFAYIFMFVNSALAQSKDFYPALILIPIYVSIMSGIRRNEIQYEIS